VIDSKAKQSNTTQHNTTQHNTTQRGPQVSTKKIYAFKTNNLKNYEGCVTYGGLAHLFTLKKSILRQMKNDRNSNISACKNIIFKKNKIPWIKETNILRIIIIITL
jgi:hypothetical protein